MRRFLALVSVFIAIASIALYREAILDAANNVTARKILYSFHTILGRGAELNPPAPSDMSIPRTIRKVFLAVEQAEGAGARVRRSIGTPSLRNFSPFLMLDHFSIKPGAGFPDQ